MRGKGMERLSAAVCEARVFLDEMPERIDVPELSDGVQGAVVFLIQAALQHGDHDILGRAAGESGEDSHDVNVELQRGLIETPDLFQLFRALLILEEIRIELDRFAHNRLRVDVQLAHQERAVVGAVWFTEMLDVPEPVILRLCVGKRIVDEIISHQVIMEQQLLDGKVVRAGQPDERDARNVQLVQHGLKLPVFIVPEDDAAFVEVPERGRKPFF